MNKLLTEAIDNSWFLYDVWPNLIRYLHLTLLRDLENKTQSAIIKEKAETFKKVSAFLSKNIQFNIKHKYPYEFNIHGKLYTAKDIRINLYIKDDITQVTGQFHLNNKIVINIPLWLYKGLLKDLKESINDIEVNTKEVVASFCNMFFEPLVHELTHLEQSIKYSTKMNLKKNDLDSTSKSLVTSLGKRGQYTSGHAGMEDYAKYFGFTDEIQAYSNSAAAYLVKEYTTGVSKQNKEEWNKRIDDAIESLKDPDIIHSQFMSFYLPLKQWFKDNASHIKERELISIWKRFKKQTYILLQLYKV